MYICKPKDKVGERSSCLMKDSWIRRSLHSARCDGMLWLTHNPENGASHGNTVGKRRRIFAFLR